MTNSSHPFVAWLVCVFLSVECRSQENSSPLFADVFARAGGNFLHDSPLTEGRHIHLTMGSGVGCLDFDRDGYVDLFFAQGCAWAGKFLSTNKTRDALLRNIAGTLSDVTDVSGLSNPWYAMGLACGDTNNDGFTDLYVSNFGQNLYFQNCGDGTFSSPVILAEAADCYSASCTWTDANGDGNSDIFISRYVGVSETNYALCTDEATQLGVLCPPWRFEALLDVLLMSNGNGTFSDASKPPGLSAVDPLPGLAVATMDFDDDGDLDIYVANDSVPNHLWVNDGVGHFTEDGILCGVALSGNGLRQAGMGIAVGDATSDGRPDIVVTNYFDEPNTFYRNEGMGFFHDVTDEIGVGAPSRSRLGFGVNFLDADGDSDLDLFVANGHVHDRLKELGRDIPYEQSAQLLTMQNGRYQDSSADAGEIFSKGFVGRGSATLDFNKDFKTDIVMTNLNGSPLLLENKTVGHGNVVKLRLIGRSCTRDAVGARLELLTADGRKIIRFADGSSSYLSCSESVISVGVGTDQSISRVQVSWPYRQQQTWTNLGISQEWALVEGVSPAFAIP